jgi:hypothetical protein
MKLVIALLALSASSLSFSKTCSEIESRTAAHDFYATVETNRLFAVPTEIELKQLKPYVTTSLYKLFSAAVLAEKEELKRSQGKEPPLFQGHLFSGITEGYTNFYVSSSVPGKKGSEIYVLLQYAQHLMPYYAATPGILEWKERVEIKPEGERCLVNNIYYALDNNNESLAGVLANIVTR